MRATILMVTILSMLMVAPVFIHVQYGEAAPGTTVWRCFSSTEEFL